jgi:hypothetical protein
VEFFKLDELVRHAAQLGRRPGKRALGVDQLGRRMIAQALVAMIAILVGRLALGARAFDEAIGQEGLGLGVVILLDLAIGDDAGVVDRLPNLVADLARGVAVRAAIMVEFNIEPGKIAHVLLLDLGDEILFAAAFLLGPNHNRRAVRVVGTDVDAPLAAEFSKSHPDVGLQVFDQMPDMNRSIGVRQRGGNQYLFGGHSPFLGVNAVGQDQSWHKLPCSFPARTGPGLRLNSTF